MQQHFKVYERSINLQFFVYKRSFLSFETINNLLKRLDFTFYRWYCCPEPLEILIFQFI